MDVWRICDAASSKQGSLEEVTQADPEVLEVVPASYTEVNNLLSCGMSTGIYKGSFRPHTCS